MLHLLKRHPFPVVAFFEYSLVLTYALPRTVLEPLLPPGLQLDTFQDFGFLAVAMVQTKGLRPAKAPRWCGQDFFHTGYRIFARCKTASGRNLRGLRILRSDANNSLVVKIGSLLTHYEYHRSRVQVERKNGILEIRAQTRKGEADLRLCAQLRGEPSLPDGSPFQNFEEASRYAGPLPFTFDYERETNSLIAVKGIRKHWNHRPVTVEVAQNTFLDQEPFRSVKPILANAFYLENVPYRWLRGQREVLPSV